MSKTRETLKAVVLDRVDIVLTDEFIDSGKPFKDIGVDSLDAIEVLISVEDDLGIELDNLRLDDCTTVKQLADYLAEFD